MREQQGQGQPGRPQQTNRQQDLAGLLGGLLGGQPVQNLPQEGSTGAAAPGVGQSNDVENILGGLLGGSGAAGQPQAGGAGQGQFGGQQGNQAGGFPQQGSSGQEMGGGDLASVLGGLLGGQAGNMGGMPSQQAPQGGMPEQSPSGGDLMGMLGGLLGGGGGGSPSGGGVLGTLLGSVIGNNHASSTVAQQTGLSETLVQALLPMILGMLLHKQQSTLRSQGINVSSAGDTRNAEEFNQVAQRVQQGENLDPQQLQSAGFTKALAQHSGYSESEVAPAVVKILQALSQNAG